MDLLVLGLTGKRGSGKDTMADYLKAEYGFEVLTYTNDVLAPILKKDGKDVTRENLITLALALRAKGGKHIITKLLCDKIESKGLWAISGVRYPEEIDYFKGKFGSAFRLVEITCAAEKRYERVVRRGTKGEGRMTMDEFMAIDERETEKAINDTVKLADTRIGNEDTMNDFYMKIDALVKKLSIASAR